MKVAFAVLAHGHPDNLMRLATRLTAENDLAVIHWDRNSKSDIAAEMARRLPPERLSRIRFARRHRVVWGDWSMVEATLACLDEIAASGETVDYVILLSGADYPLRPLGHLRAFLAENAGREYIESVDPNQAQWVVHGYNAERLLYRFYFNWRRNPRLFGRSIALQQRLGLRQRMPDGLQPRLGSQWWALTWPTALEILQRSREPHVRRFFRRTWIPDENFFQTLVADIAPDEKITQSSLTFYHFSIDGKPLVFYNDHAAFLKAQPFFFARKLSPHAHTLRDALDEAYAVRTKEPAPALDLTKNMASYERLLYLHWHALADRRVIGCDHDTDRGDLDWNRVPYFFLIDFGDLDLRDLRKALNGNGRIRCFGELFKSGRIDYDLPGEEHPGYPSGSPALRDHNWATFLYDLLHQKTGDGITGFVVPVERTNGSFTSSLRDPRALPVFLVPKRLYESAPHQEVDIDGFYRKRVLQDLLDTSGYPGWRVPVICVYDNRLTTEDIERIEARVLAWGEGKAL
ncbi:MAG: beta-1,6-N-acetylglucosaminyltransferase [Thermoanaerobaculia bacterium]